MRGPIRLILIVASLFFHYCLYEHFFRDFWGLKNVFVHNFCIIVISRRVLVSLILNLILEVLNFQIHYVFKNHSSLFLPYSSGFIKVTSVSRYECNVGYVVFENKDGKFNIVDLCLIKRYNSSKSLWWNFRFITRITKVNVPIAG